MEFYDIYMYGKIKKLFRIFQRPRKKYRKFRKNPGFLLVKYKLHQSLKKLFRDCPPESLDFYEVYFIFWNPVFWKIYNSPII